MLSLAGLVLSVLSAIGCDYVRLTFIAEDKPFYFADGEEHFGLGVFRHQDFSTDKSVVNWEHSSKCYNYGELAKEMFRDSNLKMASIYLIVALVLSAITLLVVIFAKWSGKGYGFWTCSLTSGICLASAVFQELAFLEIFDIGENSICSSNRYGPSQNGMDAWLIDYPAEDYPEVAYMRFFEKCKPGNEGKMAIAGLAAQLAAAIFISLNYYFASETVITNKENNVAKRDVFFEDSGSPDGDFENVNTAPTTPARGIDINSLGPLARAAPSGREEAFVDDISYDEPKETFEDEINAEDDLSMTQDDVDFTPPVPAPPLSPRTSALMSSKALQSGTF